MQENEISLIESGIKLILKNKNVCEKYLDLFKFLKQYKLFKTLMKERNAKKIFQNMEANYRYVIFQQSIPNHFFQLLQLLESHKGFQIYLEYLFFYCIGYSLLHNTFGSDNVKQNLLSIYYLVDTLLKVEPFVRYRNTLVVQKLAYQFSSQL